MGMIAALIINTDGTGERSSSFDTCHQLASVYVQFSHLQQLRREAAVRNVKRHECRQALQSTSQNQHTPLACNQSDHDDYDVDIDDVGASATLAARTRQIS
jgi:hypothetical protein